MDKQHSQKPTECFPLDQPPVSVLLKESNLLVAGFCNVQEEIYIWKKVDQIKHLKPQYDKTSQISKNLILRRFLWYKNNV